MTVFIHPPFKPKPTPEPIKWLGKTDKCDICGDALDRFINKMWFVDGRIKGKTQWALMCCRCFEHYGVGLGLGKGQKYDLNTKERIDG